MSSSRAMVGLALLSLLASSCDLRAGQRATADSLVTQLAAALPPDTVAGGVLLSIDVHLPLCARDDARAPRAEVGSCTSVAAGVPGTRLLDLAATASRRARETGDSDALHAAALVDLLWPDASGRSIDRAVQFLELAAAADTQSVAARIDLSAAYLSRGARNDDSGDLLRGLEHAIRATSIDSTDVRAAFNQAVALDELNVVGEAALAFGRVERVSSARHARAEARHVVDASRMRARRDRHIAYPPPAPAFVDGSTDVVVSQLVRNDRARARAYAWDSALVRWGAATRAGDSVQAASALALARQLGVALLAHGGDRSVAAAVTAISRADARTRDDLAWSHLWFGRGRDAYESSRFTDAGPAFDSALARAPVETAVHQSALLWRAIVQAQSGDPNRAATMFHTVIHDADVHGFVGLASRARSSLASGLMRFGRTSDALELVAASVRGFTMLGEPANIGLAESLEAVAHRTQNDRTGTFSALRRAVGSLMHARTSVRLHNALYLLAEMALADSLPLAALAIQREDVRVTEARRDHLGETEAQTALGRVFLQLGDTAAASTAFVSARTILRTQPEGIGRRWILSDLQLAEAARRVRDPGTPVIAQLDSGIAFFTTMVLPLRVLPALAMRAAHNVRLGRDVEAAADLEQLMSIVEHELDATPDAAQRATLLESARAASEQLMLLALRAGNTRLALRQLERGRDGARVPTGARRRDGDIAASHSVVVDLAVVADTLFAFVTRDDVVQLRRRALGGTGMEDALRRVRQLVDVQGSAATLRPHLARLYGEVIRPIEPLLGDSGTVLTIVADGMLAESPIAAFVDTVRGTYLIERWGVRYASSMREAVGFERARRGLRPRSGAAPGRAVLIADPAFDRTLSPGLERLPGARAEVLAIAHRYDRTVVIQDSGATLQAIRRSVPGARVVHFAGHARYDADAPARSALVLAGRDLADTRALAALDLRSVDLFVLAACESARERGSRATGLSGLTSALRMAGVRSVVGGLWRIPDRESAALFDAMHRAYRASGDGARALRDAQIDGIRSVNEQRRSPVAWAGVRVVEAPQLTP